MLVPILNTLQILVYLIPLRQILFLSSPFYVEAESQRDGAICPSPHSHELGQSLNPGSSVPESMLLAATFCS